MKKLILFCATLAFTSLLTIPAQAAKPDKGDKANKPKRLMKQYDTNANGSIDGDEKAAVQKAFEGDKTGPFKQFDLNNDGKLDDSELAGITGGKKKNGKEGKKAKKGAAPEATAAKPEAKKEDATK